MASPPSRIARQPVSIKVGSVGFTTVLRAIGDPAIAVACLAASCWLWDVPIDASVVLLGAFAFAVQFPGDLPFMRTQPGIVRSIAGRWCVAVALLLAVGLFANLLRLFEPEMVVTWVIATPLAQTFAHLVAPRVLLRLVALRGRHVAIVIGANELGRSLTRSLRDDPFAQTRVTAFFDDRTADRLGEGLEAPLFGKIAGVADFVRANHVDQIFIALPMASQPRILELLDELRDTTASIYFVPDVFLYDLVQARVDAVGGLPVVAVCETPFHGTNAVVKRLFDLFVAGTAVIALAPVMLAIAAAVRLTSPGPALFKQRRHGLDGHQIVVWKFRTMRVQENGAVVRQATRDDDRITPLGRFLRRTSLDELPQFFNVLQGRMSVVGPRPHAVAHNEMYRKLIKGYMIRHKVKPGITGWAQVNGARGETDTVDKMKRRIEFDLEYLRNWSLRFDLYIVWRTVVQAIRGDTNAY
jgi:putative colanic acid biosynthesis UDP-glucose lipid carrier transferase